MAGRAAPGSGFIILVKETGFIGSTDTRAAAAFGSKKPPKHHNQLALMYFNVLCGLGNDIADVVSRVSSPLVTLSEERRTLQNCVNAMRTAGVWPETGGLGQTRDTYDDKNNPARKPGQDAVMEDDEGGTPCDDGSGSPPRATKRRRITAGRSRSERQRRNPGRRAKGERRRSERFSDGRRDRKDVSRTSRTRLQGRTHQGQTHQGGKSAPLGPAIKIGWWRGRIR